MLPANISTATSSENMMHT
jgi:hypothetical protein